MEAMQDQKLENAMEDPSIPTDSTMPSQVKEEQWITVFSEKFVAQPHSQTDSSSQSDDSNNEKKVNLTGKWLLFTDIELEDEEKGMTPHDMAWQFVKELVEEGEIYAAKCSTAWEGQYPTRDGRVSGVICCYTKDYTDKKDVKRVADAIRRVYSYPENMFYKTDEDTLAKKYRHLGNQCVSIDKHTVDNEMYERDLVIRNQWNIINV
ncbi:uncharacterized protein TNCT_602861 [Trichonephila clavata]|uniref:Uncharacterized protein n=1 Tax=Trichonephila clavata TaxID=2740835 RepID=A0A8X6L0V4_TRICU|nr:uncharacterized protein TNCT_602861 [Trichonephila clavata]